jgi:hypothetical protein
MFMESYASVITSKQLNGSAFIDSSTTIQFMLDEMTNLPYVVDPSKDKIPDDAFLAEEIQKIVEEAFGI